MITSNCDCHICRAYVVELVEGLVCNHAGRSTVYQPFVLVVLNVHPQAMANKVLSGPCPVLFNKWFVDRFRPRTLNSRIGSFLLRLPAIPCPVTFAATIAACASLPLVVVCTFPLACRLRLRLPSCRPQLWPSALDMPKFAGTSSAAMSPLREIITNSIVFSPRLRCGRPRCDRG